VGQIGRIVGIAVLVLAAVTALGPLLWTVSTSLRTPAEAFTNPPQWIPLHPDFSNYSAVFDQIPIGRFFINSVIVTVLIGDQCAMLDVSRELFDRGVKCGNVAYPAVSRGQAILRFTVNARHSREELDYTVDALSAIAAARGLRGRTAEELSAAGSH